MSDEFDDRPSKRRRTSTSYLNAEETTASSGVHSQPCLGIASFNHNSHPLPLHSPTQSSSNRHWSAAVEGPARTLLDAEQNGDSLNSTILDSGPPSAGLTPTGKLPGIATLFTPLPMDDDEQFARRLQAELDDQENQTMNDANLAQQLSNDYVPDHHADERNFDWNAHLYSSRTEYDSLPDHLKYNESYHSDKDFQAALEIQKQLDREHSLHDSDMTISDDQSEPQTALRSGVDATPAPSLPASSAKEIRPKLADVNLLALRVPVNEALVPLGEVKCHQCAEILFKGPAELTSAVDSWLDAPASEGCTLTCRSCGVKVCVGCWGTAGCDSDRPREHAAHQNLFGKAKGKLRSSTKRQSGLPPPALPDWCCDEAFSRVIWLILVHFDSEYESRQAQAAAAKPFKLSSNHAPREMDFDSEEDYDLDEDFSESDDLTLGSDAIWLFPGGFQNQASNSVHAPSSEGIKPLDATAKLVMAYSQDLADLDAEMEYLDERQLQLAIKREKADSEDDMDESHDSNAAELAELTSAIEEKKSRRKEIEDELTLITKHTQNTPSKKHKPFGPAHKPVPKAKTPSEFKKYSDDHKSSQLKNHEAEVKSNWMNHAAQAHSHWGPKAAQPHQYQPGSPLPPIQSLSLPQNSHPYAWTPHTHGTIASTQSPSSAIYNTSTMPYKSNTLSSYPSYGPHGSSKLKKSVSSSEYYKPQTTKAQLPKHGHQEYKWGPKKYSLTHESPKPKIGPKSEALVASSHVLSNAQVSPVPFAQNYAFSPLSTPGYEFATSAAGSSHPYLKHNLDTMEPHATASGPLQATSKTHGPSPPVSATSSLQDLDPLADVFSLFGPPPIHADSAGHAASGDSEVPVQPMPRVKGEHDGASPHKFIEKQAYFMVNPSSTGSMDETDAKTSHWNSENDISDMDSKLKLLVGSHHNPSPPLPPPLSPPFGPPPPTTFPGQPLHGWGQVQASKHSRSREPVPRGIGYGGHDDMYPAEHYYSRRGKKAVTQPSSNKQREAFEEAILRRDQLSQRCFGLLSRLISTHHDSNTNGAGAESLPSLLLSSTCLDVAAETLRNDSLEDAKKRKDLYCAVCELVTVLAKQAGNAYLIIQERPYKRGSHLIREVCSPLKGTSLEKVTSIQSCMSNLVKQCKVISRNAKTKEARSGFKDMHEICQLILPLSELLSGLKDQTDSAVINAANIASNAALDHNLWLDYHRDHAYEDVPDEVMFADHAFGKRAAEAKEAPKGRMKRLIEEGASLSTSLPPGILVRYAENRPDVMKALIVGPAGTPYHGGMFEFDFWASEKYPAEPPKCTFRTTGGGRAHFNPNLYPCGKVCLSLLGTWAGERWRPGESTILQILVSLQAMVLCEEPWFNEPGREHGYGAQRAQSQDYNQAIQLLTVRWAMNDVLVNHADAVNYKRKTVWGDVIERYVKGNKAELSTTVQSWMRKNPGLKDVEYAKGFLSKLDQMH